MKGAQFLVICGEFGLAKAGEQNRIAGDDAASDEEAGGVGGPGEIKHVAGIEVC